MPEGRGGKISHRLNPKNTGLRHQWFQACYPATDDGSYCLIVEDDLELSPFWFTWLRKAWLKYGDRDDIAGITLSVSFYFALLESKTFFVKRHLQIYQIFD